MDRRYFVATDPLFVVNRMLDDFWKERKNPFDGARLPDATASDKSIPASTSNWRWHRVGVFYRAAFFLYGKQVSRIGGIAPKISSLHNRMNRVVQVVVPRHRDEETIQSVEKLQPFCGRTSSILWIEIAALSKATAEFLKVKAQGQCFNEWMASIFWICVYLVLCVCHLTVPHLGTFHESVSVGRLRVHLATALVLALWNTKKLLLE